MNETNVVNVDVLTKRFESFQSSKKPLLNDLDENRRHENNANKRNIKRTPAFRRDVNNTRKLVVDHSQAVVVTNNVKQFSNIIISNTSVCNKTAPTDSHSYNKTDSLNKKLYLDTFEKNEKNKLPTDQKSIINCLKKRLENNSITSGCKPKVPKKNIELPLKAHLPIGPPPKKPPRTFAHDKQIDLPYNCTMESHKNTKSDPKAMLEKLEKFITKNSHTYGPKDEKTTGKDCNSNISSKKSNLFNLAKSLKCSESDNAYGNSLKIHHTDEQNYLTRKLYNENDVEHIYDQPIFLKPNSRPNIDTANNCHTLIIGNDQICDSNKSNLHYMVSSDK